MSWLIDETVTVSPDMQGMRVDKFLSQLFPQVSRARIQQAIDAGDVVCGDVKLTRKLRLKGGENIHLFLREEHVLEDQPENLPLKIIYEDEFLLVLNKQAGLTVHPGAGQPHKTLVNALLYYNPELSHLPRAGIVHRLDKDTAGLMVVAKTEAVRLKLIEALQQHAIERVYIALVYGELRSSMKIDAAIGRHPVDRKKMAVVRNAAQAKSACTHVRILEKFAGFTLVEAQLETGRTHQIRVHLSHKGHPLVGDKVYGKRSTPSAKILPEIRRAVMQFPRQALQAVKLKFIHPQTGMPLCFEIPYASDLTELLSIFSFATPHCHDES